MFSDGNTGALPCPPTKAANLVTRDIVGETVVLPVRRGAVDINSLYVLNATGSCLWKHIDGKRTAEDLVDLLLEEFQIDRVTAEKDVKEFLESLVQSGLTGPVAAIVRAP
jgi:hypothetical protein